MWHSTVCTAVVVGALLMQDEAPAPRQGTATPPSPALAERDKRTPPTAPRLEIDFRNELEKSFILVEARFLLDNVEIRHLENPAGLAKDLPVFNGPIPPGSHLISAELRYQGRNRGVFTYLDSYKVNVESMHAFVADEKPAAFTIVARKRKGVTVPLDEKPIIAFEPKPEPSPAASPTPNPAAKKP